MAYYVTEDNTKLYYKVEGSGQPVVFLHGWSSSHEHLADIVKEMKKSYCCISYCHRGHGASSLAEGGYNIQQLARDLAELMEYLDLRDVVLVGHSMGGYTIYEYIKQFGCGNLKKVFIIDMSPKIACDEDWKFGAFGSYNKANLIKDLKLMSQDMSAFLAKSYKKILPAMAVFPVKFKMFMTPGLKGVNHSLPLVCLWIAMFTEDYRDVVPSISVPLGYALPEIPIYPREAAEFLQENSGSTVKIFEYPGCTHMVPLENPEQMAKDIMQFIEE